MKFRLAIVLALAALLYPSPLAGTSTLAQNQDADGVRALLFRLEQIVQASDARAYKMLLSETADQKAAADFVSAELLPGATRAVLKERDREPLPGILPGNGYRLSIDTFTEFGARARSTTWRLDVKRVGEGGEESWRISGQQRRASS